MNFTVNVQMDLDETLEEFQDLIRYQIKEELKKFIKEGFQEEVKECKIKLLSEIQTSTINKLNELYPKDKIIEYVHELFTYETKRRIQQELENRIDKVVKGLK